MFTDDRVRIYLVCLTSLIHWLVIPFSVSLVFSGWSVVHFVVGFVFVIMLLTGLPKKKQGSVLFRSQKKSTVETLVGLPKRRGDQRLVF
jgi:hypothetical protein